jgi:hypothetical protein
MNQLLTRIIYQPQKDSTDLLTLSVMRSSHRSLDDPPFVTVLHSSATSIGDIITTTDPLTLNSFVLGDDKDDISPLFVEVTPVPLSGSFNSRH